MIRKTAAFPASPVTIRTRQLVRDPAFYDAKCLTCHASQCQFSRPEALAKPCRTGTKRCSSLLTCPRRSLPGTHASFTDHFIRIVRPGASPSEVTTVAIKPFRVFAATLLFSSLPL